MTFSTYAFMDEGLALTILTVATITFIGWAVEKVKRRRLERLVAEMESPTSAATESLAVSRAR